MHRLDKMKKTGMKNVAFLVVTMAVLNGCCAEEVNTREETQTVAENEEQSADVTEDRQEIEEDVNSGEESVEVATISRRANSSVLISVSK